MASQAVLITGCSSGIGRATAERLAGRGFAVYATARRLESLAGLEALGCRILALDVTDEPSMQAAVAVVTAEHGAVGALVNNAGYSQSGAIEEVPLEDVRRQFETNVFGLVRMCQLVLPGMRAQQSGRIVNVSSMGANFTFPGGGLYHATKYAVEAISDALRFEVAGFGIHVVIVQPGLIRTRFAEAAGDAIQSSTPAGGAVRRVQRRGRRHDQERLRARSARAPGRRPGDRRADDRAGDHHEVAEDPLPRDAVGAPARGAAGADDRRHVGPDAGVAVPAAGGVATRARGRAHPSSTPSSRSSASLRYTPPV